MSQPSTITAASQRTIVSFRNIRFSYDRTSAPVLQIPELAIHDKEITAVVGASGVGKTTLLGLIIGRLTPDFGERSYAIDAAKPGMFGYVSQSESLIPWLNCLQNVEYPLQYVFPDWSRSRRRAVAMEYLEHVGVARNFTKFPGELSGGMKRRVMVARALVYSPRIVVLDEPFTGLDLYAKDGLIDLLVDLHQQRSFCLVWVTHDLQDVVLLSHVIYYFGMGGEFYAEPVRITELLGSRNRFSERTRHRAEEILHKMGAGS